MLKYMLDTNTVIYTIRNRPAAVRERFKQHDGQMCISSVTLGELVFGAEKSAQPERNLKDIEGLIARLEVAAFDEKAALHFGQIRAELARAGKPIGPYDSMIAGHARAQGLILVANDIEFRRVPGLRLENWV
ncbi:tRNA(fMet)-specific endonuclease VapC [Burkholderiaceae bacterium FT117]|uniref:type II toxin-antitoxin system tRNA(fMet)-specific endonuclease VapC n=1 Tax=Zeimonas sediminis TaxID=2944268 RepID=UPI002342E049|nr:tRNA(fMet)-specific endonuclease VapC [Zeimonas sediminis]MCM5569902.1 tRNA(fMet)-specific endonuclease VapC [Zeimonas sediminis]